MKKDYLDSIVSTIKEYINSRKYFNEDYKKLVKTQKIEYCKSIDPKLTGWHNIYSLPEYMDKCQSHSIAHYWCKQRIDLLDNYHNYDTFYIIYKDGSSRTFTALEILVNDAKYIKFTNIAYAYYLNSDCEFDTETGELNYDVSNDEHAEAYQNYRDSIEIKYQTEWGKRHSSTTQDEELCKN